MYSKNPKTRIINPSLTNSIIRLHDLGYTEDFVAIDLDGRLVITHGENGDIFIVDFQISIINQFFDRLSFQFTYLHAIETSCGLRGIVLSSSVLFTNNIQVVRMKNRYQKMHSFQRAPIAYQQAI